MRRLVATRTLAFCLLGALAIAMPAPVGVSTAQAQTLDGSGVEKLWEEFPLEGDRSRANDGTSPPAGSDATPAGRSGQSPAAGSVEAEGADGTQSAPVDPAAETPARQHSEPASTDEGERDKPSIRALLSLLVLVVVAAALARVIGSSWSAPTSVSPASSAPRHAAAGGGARGSKPETSSLSKDRPSVTASASSADSSRRP
jgi:hypothetical protein